MITKSGMELPSRLSQDNVVSMKSQKPRVRLVPQDKDSMRVFAANHMCGGTIRMDRKQEFRYKFEEIPLQ